MLKKYILLFLVSMLPIIELRGGIPIGVGYGIDLWLCYVICVIGNILPVPFIIFFGKQILYWFAKQKKIGPFFRKIIDRADRKAKTIGKAEFWGIFAFVAIPLPGTGAWTGSLIATLLQMRLKKAIPAIALGVVTSGIIMLIVSLLVKHGIISGIDLFNGYA